MDISEQIQFVWLTAFPYKDSKFFSEDCKAVSFRLFSKKGKKQKKKSLRLWLCNQTSRQILILSKVFPSFHYDFKSFHLDLVYTEHHQTVPVLQPQSFKKLMLYLCCLAIWAFLAHKALTHLTFSCVDQECMARSLLSWEPQLLKWLQLYGSTCPWPP